MTQKKRRPFVGPKKIPQAGFYYHYKHDPSGAFNNYAYRVIAIGCHTEDDCRPVDRFHVEYRPLYEEAAVYRVGKGTFTDSRPLSMFMSKVRKGRKTLPRFTLITDPALIKKLKKQHDRMYARL